MKELMRYGVIVCLVIYTQISSVKTIEALPRVQWKQIATTHFVTIFAEPHREAAQQMTRLAEASYEEFSQLFDYEDDSTTYILITDQTDRFHPKDMLGPGDYDESLLILSTGQPQPEFFIWSGQMQDWLNTQFLYQYTNLVRNRMTGWLRATVAKIFPDEGFSAWMRGGLAAYMTAQMQADPGSSSYFDMLLRAEIVDKNLSTLDQYGAVGLRNWPGNLASFVYGYSFFQYLTNTYGQERLPQLLRVQSQITPWPGFGRDPFKQVYGKSLSSLKKEWRTSVQNIYAAQIHDIKSQPLTSSEPLSDTGYFAHSPVFSPDGQFIYYIDASPHDEAALTALRLSDDTKKRLVPGKFSGSFSISADGRFLYFCKTEIYRKFYEISDVYRLDLETGKITRLSKGAHAVDPAISPDGKTLVYVVTDNMHLMSMNLESGEYAPLLATSGGVQIRRPTFSADGSRLAFHIWTPQEGQNIYMIMRDGTGLTPITHDAALDSDPVWAMRDEYLLFSSDRSGVSNIFAYSLSEGRLFQISNVLTGVFNPAISPDGSQLAVAYYSSTGMNIHRISINQTEWQARAYQPEDAAAPEVLAEDMVLPEEARYKPLVSLGWPDFEAAWGEDEDGWQLGVTLSDHDILRQHEYTLTTLYGLDSGRLAVEAEYLNNQLYPSIHLFGYDSAEVYSDLFINKQGEDEDYWEHRQGAGINLQIPLYRSHATELSLLAGYEYAEIEHLTDMDDLLLPWPNEGTLASVSGGLLLNRGYWNRYALHPEPGQLLFFTYTRYDEMFGSDFNIDELTAEAAVSLKMPYFRHHVLSLKAAAGLSDGDTLTQGVFQLGGYMVRMTSHLVYEPEFFLRGYEENTVAGDRIALGTLEYHLPLWFPQRTIWQGRILLDSIEATAFTEAGDAWDHNDDPEWYLSAGGELNMRFGLHYGNMPVLLGIGMAHGFDEESGETQVYAVLGIEL